MDITLEDVEIAIKVLEEFEKKYRDATRILRRLGIRPERGSALTPENVMRMVMESSLAGKGVVQPSEEVEEPISEEELSRLRSLKEKIKGKVDR